MDEMMATLLELYRQIDERTWVRGGVWARGGVRVSDRVVSARVSAGARGGIWVVSARVRIRVGVRVRVGARVNVRVRVIIRVWVKCIGRCTGDHDWLELGVEYRSSERAIEA